MVIHMKTFQVLKRGVVVAQTPSYLALAAACRLLEVDPWSPNVIWKLSTLDKYRANKHISWDDIPVGHKESEK